VNDGHRLCKATVIAYSRERAGFVLSKTRLIAVRLRVTNDRWEQISVGCSNGNSP